MHIRAFNHYRYANVTDLQKKLKDLKEEYDTKSKAFSASLVVAPDVTNIRSAEKETAPSNESGSKVDLAQTAINRAGDSAIETTSDVSVQDLPTVAVGEHDEPMPLAEAGPQSPPDPHSKL